tara:strand:+ start:182 stop:610 length:429 start_codon:yes stop_codon:yes gene_type:complete
MRKIKLNLTKYKITNMATTRPTFDTDNENFNYSSNQGYIEVDITKYPIDKLSYETYTDQDGNEQTAVKLKLIYFPCDNQQVRRSATHSLLPNLTKEENAERKKNNDLPKFCGTKSELKLRSNKTSQGLPEGKALTDFIGKNA